MSTMHTEERIGEAWRQHRMGNYTAAIEIYEDVLKKAPNHLDAMYGLGLARRSNGDVAGATEIFEQALKIAQDALDAVEKTSLVDGHRGANDLDTYEDDRFLMLSRMIRQRLAELT